MDADRTAWSPLTAYVFGYWLADGNMHYQTGSGGYLVAIGSADVAHLALLRDLLGVGRIQPIVGSPGQAGDQP
jgi:hypothetical protein